MDDHCRGIWRALLVGRTGQIYNFGGGNQIRNIDLVRSLVGMFGKTEEDGVEFVTDRAGHDFRYDINYWKATAELEWKPMVEFKEGLKRTVEWYRNVKKDEWKKSLLSS